MAAVSSEGDGEIHEQRFIMSSTAQRERMLSMYDAQNKSEVARIRQLIALEYESVEQGIKGLAVTSRHDFIARRQQNIQCYVQDLAAIVGENEATRMAFESCLGID
jgi:hypothetical protein